MQDYTKISTQAEAGYDAGLRAYMLKVYNFMAAALGITGVVAFTAGNSQTFWQVLAANPMLSWIIIFAPLGFVLFLGFRLQKMSYQTALITYLAYSAVMGLSMAFIFMAYTQTSIAKTFFISAGTFSLMSLYGYSTKKDLTGLGSFLRMGLLGLILAMLVNLFLGSGPLDFVISIIGVGIFVGLIAYDTQRIKSMYYAIAGNAAEAGKAAIYGALQLYLDFINLFIFLLRFVGDRR